MTHKLYIFLLTSILTSCEVSEIGNVFDGNCKSIKMTVPSYIQENQSRSVLFPSENGTTFRWERNDIVGVYSYSKGLTNFFIDDETISEDGSSANFKGEGFDLKANSFYYALYPYNSSSLDKYHIPVSYRHQEVKTIADFTQLSEYDYMTSIGETDSNGNVEFSFNHIGSVVDLAIQVPHTATFTKVRIETEEGLHPIFTGGFVNLTKTDVTIESDRAEDKDTVLTVTFNNPDGIECIEDSIVHVYLMMPPQDLSSQNLMIRLVDNHSNWYSAIVPGKNMKAGYTYHYTIIKESNNGFSGSGCGLPNDFEIEMQSSYSYERSYKHEAVLANGTTIYSIGGFGVSKFDISNPQLPQHICTNSLSTKHSMLARSITQNDDYLYICKRTPLGGMDAKASPQIILDFDSHIQSFETAEGSSSLSNKSNFNEIFSKLCFKSVEPSSIKTVFIFKAYFENGKYRNCIRFQDINKVYCTIFNQSYNTEIEAFEALQSYYENANGDACGVNWENVTTGRTTIANLILNLTSLGTFDSYAHKGTAYINELGEGCPNRGKYSANLVATATNGEFAILKKILNKEVCSCELSFWIKLNSITSGFVELPLLGASNDIPVISLHVENSSNNYVNISLKGSEILTSEMKSISIGEWVNLKIKVTENKVSLFYRPKENSSWETCVESIIQYKKNINSLLVGLISFSENVNINIDDVYYNEKDIDDCSYINGQLDIVRKSDLKIENRYYLDLKPTGSAVSGKTLFVNFLMGYNIYDLSNPINPILKFAYRSPDWKEYQGCQIFTNNGKTYAFLCNYSQGFTIVDITNIENPINVIEDSHGALDIDGVSLYKKGFNFDITMDFPYAYATYCTRNDYLNSIYDYKGIITYDLSNLDNIKMTITPIPKDKCFEGYIENRICKLGSRIYLSCAEKGVAVFNINSNGIPTFSQMFQPENNSNIHSISTVGQGIIVAGSDYNPLLNKNIYIYKVY